MSYDFNLIRTTIKEEAEYRKRVKAAFRLPHGSAEHLAAKGAIPCVGRDDFRAWVTALHYAYAEARGKQHSATPTAVWARSLPWNVNGSKLLEDARALITERPVPQVTSA